MQYFKIDGDNVFLDYTYRSSFLELSVLGIESYYFPGPEIRIYAKSVILEWCFAPQEDWEKVGISNLTMEKIGYYKDGDVIKSKEFTSWNNSEAWFLEYQAHPGTPFPNVLNALTRSPSLGRRLEALSGSRSDGYLFDGIMLVRGRAYKLCLIKIKIN